MIELNKIYNESNLETMAKMPDGFIDLTVTSPPYDNLRDYKGYSFEFEEVAKELYRITKPGGVVVWVVGDATIDGSESGTSFRQALYFKEVGFKLHDTMIYQKASQPKQNGYRYEQDFEYMFILSKGKAKIKNPLTERCINAGSKVMRTSRDNNKDDLAFSKNIVSDLKVKGNVWFYGTKENETGHPAIFPEQLAADHIYSWSNESDIVYDCFGGSGTTAKMAHLQKRNWILSEISKEYVELAEKRLKPYLAQMTIF